MKKTFLTLAETLDKIHNLNQKVKDLNGAIEINSSSLSYRGEKLRNMDPNRMLYFIATHEIMKETLLAIGSDTEGDDIYPMMLVRCNMKGNGDAIDVMKALIEYDAQRCVLTNQVDALHDHAKTFDAEDHKRIKKEKSLNTLKHLGIL